MKSSVRIEETFHKPAKKLQKKYPSFADDLLGLIAELEQNPLLGVSLGDDLRKVRMAIRSKQRGKSGGARVITCLMAVRKSVHLLTVYDKAEADTIDELELRALVEEFRNSLEDEE